MSVRKVLNKSSRTKSTTTSTSELKDALLKWICERHATNGPLDRKLLRDKAMELATSFRVIGFKCSEAWLTVFLKKHGFSPSLTNCNGPTFADYRVWIDLLRSLITQYRHKDLFNVDELVMYSDFLPSRKPMTIPSPSHQHGDNIPQNYELSRISPQTKRIGILLCCNSSGSEKLEPLISNPYILEKSGSDRRYDRHEVSCINDDAFGNWLEKLNTQMSNSHRNILLLLSRERIRSLHNFQRLSNVKLVFLPKDFPTQLRPLRGDIFHCVKMTYRCRYVEFIRRRATTREWGTKEIVESVFEAWKDVPQELVVSSFQRTKFREDESFLKIQCPDWDTLETGMSFRKFVTFDDELSETSNNREIDGEMRFLSCRNNERRYNLRKSRRDTVELDDHDEVFNEQSRDIRKIAETRDANETVDHVNREKDDNERLSPNVRGSSRIEEIQDSREENVESRNATISGLADLTIADKSSESIVDDVATGTIDRDTDKMESMENREIFNTLTSRIYENPEKRRIVMDRCLGGTKYLNANIRPEVSSLFDENAAGRYDNAEADTMRFALQKETVTNLPGVAGSSGEGFYDSQEIPRDRSSPCALKFNDEEKIANDEELRLNILNAIEICDDNEEFKNDENPTETNDPSPGSSKRSRNSVVDYDNINDDDEPMKKRARSDGNWSKCYEKNFVFGPEPNPNENDLQTSTNDARIDHDSPVSSRSIMSQTGTGEIEKRCIFTLEGGSNLPNVSYPKTKD